MHELGIAQSIVEAVLKKMQSEGYRGVSKIGLRIGGLTDIVPDALEFGYEASVRDTPLAATQLVIETIPVQGTCRACSRNFVIEDYLFICPDCGGQDIAMTQGDELEIAYIEIDDGETDAGTS